MKGIVLAGGRATRLRPLTKITSKQLLPVYDKPMIYYPIETLINAGIKDILIIIAPDYSGQFLNLLGSGSDFGARFTYEIQEEPRGLTDAFIIGEHFIENDDVTMILGDNIFDYNFRDEVQKFAGGGLAFAKKVADPARYAVVEFDENNKVVSIIEKPDNPKSDYAVPGIYIFDNKVAGFAKRVTPSNRGELEIPDLYNQYLKIGELKVNVIDCPWEDAGTFDSLLRINNYWANKSSENKSA